MYLSVSPIPIPAQAQPIERIQPPLATNIDPARHIQREAPTQTTPLS